MKLTPRNWDIIADGRVSIEALKPNGISFDFPSFYVYRFLTAYTQAITQGQLSINLSVKYTSGYPIFEFKPELINQGTLPPDVRLYIEAKESISDTDRWWSNPAYFNLSEGAAKISIQIIPDRWSAANGLFANDNPDTLESFNETLFHPGRIGFSFGGGSFFGHGVKVKNGQARFSIHDFALS